MSDVSPETKALQAALETAQRDRDAERSRRLEAEGNLRTETGTRFAAQESAVHTAIEQAEAHASLLQQKWVALQSEGNFEEAGKVTREMADSSARINNLKAQKDYIERQKATAATPSAPDLSDRFNSAEREWIAKNPRYLSDDSFQRKVNAAALYAVEHEGHAKDTPAYWQAIEAKIYPDRAQTADPEVRIVDPEPAPAGEYRTEFPMEQQHTRDVQVIMPTVDPPAMNIDMRPEDPQPRAAGGGGQGTRAVAAPPSRRMAELSRQRAPSGQLNPTQQEYEMAIQQYNDIEPNAEDRSPEAAVRWYAAHMDPKLHRNRRRERWVFSEGSAA